MQKTITMKSNNKLNTRLTAYCKKPESFLPQTENGFYVQKEAGVLIAENLIYKPC